MMTTRHIPMVALCVMMATSGWGEEAPPSPELVVKEFYAACFEARPSGLPTEAELKILSPFFSPELAALFVKARKYQAGHIRAYPDDKPPLMEGDLFSSLFEGPTGFEVGPSEKMDQRHRRVYVRFSHVDPKDPEDVFRWKDAVIVKRQGNGFVIEDFEFLGDWPFKNGDRLSAILKNLE